jgi:hypothetical protein
MYEHDVVIAPGGEISKRKKKLSKRVTGTSHVMSKDEAKFLAKFGASTLIIGSGQSGMLTLSEEAEAYLRKKGCALNLARTPRAIELYNQAEEPITSVFHVTC